MGNTTAEITRVADGKGIMSDIAARASRDHLLEHDTIWTRAGRSVKRSTAREDGKLVKSKSAT
jgi:hypothetical protein